MDSEKVVIAVKNVLEREIQSLKIKVEKNQEFINFLEKGN